MGFEINEQRVGKKKIAGFDMQMYLSIRFYQST